MTEPATQWQGPTTGLDALERLAAAAATTAPGHPERTLWTLVHAAYPAAATALAGASGSLTLNTQPRSELDSDAREKLRRCRRQNALELLEDLGRALLTANRTLAAMSARAADPVHPQERPGLQATVRRRLVILGCASDELTVRRLTTAAILEIAKALDALPAPSPQR